MLKVNCRDGFSDRMGIEPLNNEMQLKELDKRSRIEILNSLHDIYEYLYNGFSYKSPQKQALYKNILRNIYCQKIEVNSIYYESDVFDIITETILNDEYHAVLTVVERLGEFFDSFWREKTYNPHSASEVYKYLNATFEKEYVGYRFVGNYITPITDEVEINVINETEHNECQIVQEHIIKAVSLLSDREKPDYENSIKESISAVEAICQVILNVNGKEASLGNMLKKLEDEGVEIHPAMKQAFNILYGYTSDANGIRHAGNIGGPSSTFEEAKFMLVSCCAFINYLQGVRAS